MKEPIINIRLRNFTVTVLGQVARPGTYPTNGEQITILEALGLAGDLTLRGKRENVLVIQEEGKPIKDEERLQTFVPEFLKRMLLELAKRALLIA